MFVKILIYLFLGTYSLASIAGVTEEELEKFEEVLPKDLTPKKIADWPEQVTYKKMVYSLHVGTSRPRLRRRYYNKLEKKGKVLIRITGGVMYTSSSGGKSKRYVKGAANIYLYSVGDTVKLAAHKKVKLAKLCPT